MDDILSLFLETQRAEGQQLAAQSDLLSLEVLDEQRIVAEYRCRGLVRDGAGEVRVHDHFAVGFCFGADYLRHVDPGRLVTWLGPAEIWHPNIGPPFVCLGSVAPGTPLVELLHRSFELITWSNVTMREDDALNRAACAWARRHRDAAPVDARPIKWRAREAS